MQTRMMDQNIMVGSLVISHENKVQNINCCYFSQWVLSPFARG